MDIQVKDILIMKKNHPCGCNTFEVIRSGMDLAIRSFNTTIYGWKG